MTDFESKHIGNMRIEDIHTNRQFPNYAMSEESLAGSLAETWRQQGIQYEVTDPVPTEKLTSEQLQAMGCVGIRLLYPLPDQDTL